jgi:RNase P/RNase MRP subunit POP5
MEKRKVINQKTIRKSRRYIAVKIDSKKPFGVRDFYEAVWDNILKLFGEYGASQTALLLIAYDSQKNQAILRCSTNALDLVRISLLTLTEIRNEKIIIQISLISGTLKALRNKLKTFQ